MVSSRSKTAAEAAGNKRTTRSAVASGAAPKVSDISAPEQENKKRGVSKKSAAKPASSKPPVASTTAPAKPTAKGKKKVGGTYCLCNGEDDGTPMIKCEGGCQNWYHFRCVDLDEDVAGEIEKYYCPDCETKTGLKTVSKLDFEGSHAFVEPPPPPQPIAKKTQSKNPVDIEEIDVVESPEETDGAGSGDDYIAEPSIKKAGTGKRVARRLSPASDDSDADDDDDGSDGGHRRRASKSGRLKRLKKASASPAPEASSAPKRRSSSAQQPAAKRSKTTESAQDDAIRKYCLTKLEEIVRPMFEEYREAEPASQTEGQVEGEEGSENKEPSMPLSSAEDEKSVLDQKVKAFVTELERCMMETYAEPDKTGRPSAGGKYKERFRMLQFNLPKRDRVAVRKGIASGRITPAQLNVMSSTDLADEQTKHEIELAEKEALEHSILQKITAPQAKITHKGLETIEDVSGQRAAEAAARQEEEQRMEMEKREREKLARLRTHSVQQSSPTSATQKSPLSATFPKTSSPTVMSASSLQRPWGAPPPTPGQAQQGNAHPTSPSSNRPSVRPPFMPSMPSMPSISDDQPSTEQGLSLDDIMNIDDDVPAKDGPPSNPQQRMNAQVSAETGSSSSPIITTPSGPSPFVPSKPSTSSHRRPSFDLNALWTGPSKQDVLGDGPAAKSTVESAGESNRTADPDNAQTSSNTEEAQDEAMELESNDDDELALDALLEQSASTTHNVQAPVAKPQSTVDSLPEVWSGQIVMPRESFDALTIDISCKQVGGRTLEPGSGYWRNLFTSPQARIDGRVPIGQSTKYLVSVRMNSSKELIVVTFIPRSDEARARFNELVDFLIGKDRHALVFPWGTHPRPEAPGRELYIIPLLKDQPLPEFIELMDDHRVPRERTSNMLLGAFVLNKGKLSSATPPPAPAPVPPAPVSTPTQFPLIPSMTMQMPSIPNVSFPSVTPVAQPPAAQPPTGVIDQSALAAEVASLTPEQISLMLRHLQQSVPLATTVAAPPQPPTSVPPPSATPPTFTMPGMPPFPPQFPPANLPHVQSPPGPGGQFSPPRQFSPPHPPAHYEDRHFGDRDDRYKDFGREGYGGHGARGRGSDRGKRGHGHRGRGKPFHDDRSTRPPPAADSGWGGRGRGGGPR